MEEVFVVEDEEEWNSTPALMHKSITVIRRSCARALILVLLSVGSWNPKPKHSLIQAKARLVKQGDYWNRLSNAINESRILCGI